MTEGKRERLVVLNTVTCFPDVACLPSAPNTGHRAAVLVRPVLWNNQSVVLVRPVLWNNQSVVLV